VLIFNALFTFEAFSETFAIQSARVQLNVCIRKENHKGMLKQFRMGMIKHQHLWMLPRKELNRAKRTAVKAHSRSILNT